MKLDSDICMLSPGWLDQALQAFEGNRDVGLVSLRQRNHVIMHCMRFAPRGGSRLPPCCRGRAAARWCSAGRSSSAWASSSSCRANATCSTTSTTPCGSSGWGSSGVVWDVLVHHQIHLDGNQADPTRERE